MVFATHLTWIHGGSRCRYRGSSRGGSTRCRARRSGATQVVHIDLAEVMVMQRHFWVDNFPAGLDLVGYGLVPWRKRVHLANWDLLLFMSDSVSPKRWESPSFFWLCFKTLSWRTASITIFESFQRNTRYKSNNLPWNEKNHPLQNQWFGKWFRALFGGFFFWPIFRAKTDNMSFRGSGTKPAKRTFTPSFCSSKFAEKTQTTGTSPKKGWAERLEKVTKRLWNMVIFGIYCWWKKSCTSW